MISSAGRARRAALDEARNSLKVVNSRRLPSAYRVG
jgi:hypothetical protein